MKGTEDEQSGLRGRQREGNGFQIAHFANQDDVGIFAKGGFQARWKADRVLGDITLGDDAQFVAVNKFDGLFNR